MVSVYGVMQFKRNGSVGIGAVTRMKTKARQTAKEYEYLKTCRVADWKEVEDSLVFECYRQGVASRACDRRIAFCAEILARSLCTFAFEYLPDSDWNLRTIIKLIDMFNGSGKHDAEKGGQAIDVLFDELRSGRRWIQGKNGFEKVASKFKRHSDGARPAQRTHGARIYGFWPGEDLSLDLFDRYCYMSGPNYECKALKLLTEAVVRTGDRAYAELAAREFAEG